MISRKYISPVRYEYAVATFNSISGVEWLQVFSSDIETLSGAFDKIEPETDNPSSEVDLGIVFQNLVKGVPVASDGKCFTRCIMFYSRSDQVTLLITSFIGSSMHAYCPGSSSHHPYFFLGAPQFGDRYFIFP
jgi:hypothetical protein